MKHHFRMVYIQSAQSAGAVENDDCILAESKNPLNKCPRYDTKPSDGEAPVLELWEM